MFWSLTAAPTITVATVTTTPPALPPTVATIAVQRMEQQQQQRLPPNGQQLHLHPQHLRRQPPSPNDGQRQSPLLDGGGRHPKILRQSHDDAISQSLCDRLEDLTFDETVDDIVARQKRLKEGSTSCDERSRISWNLFVHARSDGFASRGLKASSSVVDLCNTFKGSSTPMGAHPSIAGYMSFEFRSPAVLFTAQHHLRQLNIQSHFETFDYLVSREPPGKVASMAR